MSSRVMPRCTQKKLPLVSYIGVSAVEVYAKTCAPSTGQAALAQGVHNWAGGHSQFTESSFHRTSVV